MPQIYLLYENDEWLAPIRAALEKNGLDNEAWQMDDIEVALGTPPDGLFVNRMSASAHTRNHRFAPELTSSLVDWLESHGRRVINGSGALRLELSKISQYAALEAAGIRTPRTVAALGRDAVVRAARSFEAPFIVKHNRAGKGLGVRLFETVEACAGYVHGPDFEEPVDGITLVQQYVRAPQPEIVRAEFVGGRFLYAVRVDTAGGFELCPADACEPGAGGRPKFEILGDGYEPPLREKYERLMAAHGIDIAAFEFIADTDGNLYTYDINTNTNYNSAAEEAAGLAGGMAAQAALFAVELARLYPGRRARSA
ncbi:MAG: hypothetical protein WD270_01610 [Acetobacterales bacterium]